jgi:hypothetical protein
MSRSGHGTSSVSSISLHLVIVTISPPVSLPAPAPAPALTLASAPTSSAPASCPTPLDRDTAPTTALVLGWWTDKGIVHRDGLIEQFRAVQGLDGGLGLDLGGILNQDVALV